MVASTCSAEASSIVPINEPSIGFSIRMTGPAPSTQSPARSIDVLFVTLATSRSPVCLPNSSARRAACKPHNLAHRPFKR